MTVGQKSLDGPAAEVKRPSPVRENSPAKVRNWPQPDVRLLVSVCGLRVLQTRDIRNIHLIYLQHSQASTKLNSRKARLPSGCDVRYF